MLASLCKTFTIAAALLGALTAANEDWGYNELDESMVSPAHWGLLYPICDGTSQSPVNLMTRGPSVQEVKWRGGRPLRFEGNCNLFKLKTLPDVYKFEVTGNQVCKLISSVDGEEKAYTLLQFHAHMSSEHTINGMQFPAEFHFVHQEVGGSNLLVVGLLINYDERAKEVAWFDDVLSALTQSNPSESVPVYVDLKYTNTLKRATCSSKLFTYLGSLTTPPCSEIVTWWVVPKPINVSPDRMGLFGFFHNLLPAANRGLNNRPVQALNDRTLYVY